MTRTDPPDLLESTVYQDMKLNPTSGHSVLFASSKECNSQMSGKLEQNHNFINKRHCRSFDFIESLDDPKSLTSMEYPCKTERQTANKDALWNGFGQPGHLRFSSPDLFNTRLPSQQSTTESASDTARGDPLNKTRSISAPRARATLTPVPITVSPPTARRGREAHRAPTGSQRRPEPTRIARETSHPSNRALVNEVHPIKLQPHTPLYVSESFEVPKPDKPNVSPHVRCRVDIKPDAAVLQHTARRPLAPRADLHWQRYSASGIRSVSVPRQMSTSTSTTPTPSDCYSGDHWQACQYSNFMPNNYGHSVDIPLSQSHPFAYPRAFLGREYRTLSNPNIPTKFFYTEDPCRYPVQPPGRIYCQDDQYSSNSSNSQNPSVNGQYVQDPMIRWVHTLPVRPCYSEVKSHRVADDPFCNRPYSLSEPGPYIIPTTSPGTYYTDDPRAFPFQNEASKLLYTRPCQSPAEYSLPIGAYQTDGRQRPRMSQVFSDDWQRSSISGYSSQYTSSQATPQRVRQDPGLTPWFPNGFTEPCKLGAEARHYSKSWDNILIPPLEREHAVPRGRSYENLFRHGRQDVSPDERQQPVIVNLSSSPRRYAALSLSENSLEKCRSDNGRNSMSRQWFVTPEITITDNDIRGYSHKKKEGGSVSWNVPNGGGAAVHKQEVSDSAHETSKDRKHNSYSLQQSLEQLDELLADLVVDYKPPNSRKNSEDLLDQLKHLINDNDTKGERVASFCSEDQGAIKTPLSSSKTSPDSPKDPDSGCDGLQRSMEDLSLNHSTEEEEAMVCTNVKCARKETLFNACLYFKSCHSCYTFYCSRNCRRDDWDSHKENCLHGRISSICRHILKHCRETLDVHKAFSRIARIGYLSRGRGVLFLGFPNPGSADNFLQVGLESLLMSPTYLSLRELESFKDSLGEYCKDLLEAGKEYDPSECFLLNVSIAVGELVPNRPAPRIQTPTVRKYAKITLASSSPDKKFFKKDCDMETLILTPPPGTSDIDKDGQEGQRAREVCFINIQRELRTRGVFLRHEYPQIYTQLCEFVESNKRFTPTTIYPIDKRTGRQFMCMIMAASEPRTLDWVSTPHLLDDII
ncbi:apical junction component 1 homolog [Denticeps clupeoides]|uniref:Apical junction molecule ajm1 alpha/beta domain-containing protein n=1 Tax=Denticeps clupeoides TaxID=299321 RepID=A0AAY4ET75_9TELE|nr:apical junction component 1 homolog [Denticeps clupeoides]XP_028852941.1 apical junction component 1 homolog [Denticeps clupeoides]